MHEQNESPMLSGIDKYNSTSSFIETKIHFHGKSLKEWLLEIKLPELSEHLTEDELILLNREAIQVYETVYKNLSLSKVHYLTTKAAYNRKLNDEKNKIRSEIEANNSDPSKVKIKMPSIDVIESQASAQCIIQFQANTIAELFYEFWNIHAQSIQLFNTRITSLSITKNLETRSARG